MAKKEQAKAPAADADGKPAGKSKLKLIILIVVGLLLAIGLSVGATLFFLKGDKKEEAKSEEHAATEDAGKPVKKQAIYEVLAPAFVVNYNYKGRQRYMQVSVALMGRDKAELDALHEHMPVLRNNLVMLFSAQSFDTLATPVGQEMLRQKVTASVQEVAQKELGKVVVEQALFTNFVLQ